jgi:hypothetical protein
MLPKPPAAAIAAAATLTAVSSAALLAAGCSSNTALRSDLLLLLLLLLLLDGALCRMAAADMSAHRMTGSHCCAMAGDQHGWQTAGLANSRAVACAQQALLHGRASQLT